MIWNKKTVVPRLSRQAMERGNVDGGHSVPLIFKHRSGSFSFGDAVIHKGVVAWWYPGDMADVCHVPETKDAKDPIIEWAEFPNICQVVEAFETWEDEGRNFHRIDYREWTP